MFYTVLLPLIEYNSSLSSEFEYLIVLNGTPYGVPLVYYFVPVEPKPPAPLTVSDSSSCSINSAVM